MCNNSEAPRFLKNCQRTRTANAQSIANDRPVDFNPFEAWVATALTSRYPIVGSLGRHNPSPKVHRLAQDLCYLCDAARLRLSLFMLHLFVVGSATGKLS